MYSIKDLISLRTKAKKQRKWNTILSRLDRNFFDLACIVVNRIESKILYELLLGIVNRIKKSLQKKFLHLVKTKGRERAFQMAFLAFEWGHFKASNWVDDFQFARYLTFIEINTPKGWSV